MSAENNLSVTLFRGVKRHPNNVAHYRIGEHWTNDLDVAKDFATVGTIKGEYDPSEGHGTVIEAKVTKGDVIQPYTKEWEERGVDISLAHLNYCRYRCKKRQCEMDFLEPCYADGFAGEIGCNRSLDFSECPTRLYGALNR